VRRFLASTWLIPSLLVSGCAFDHHRDGLERLAAAGMYERAAEVLDEPATRRLYGERDRALWNLDRGAVALALDDYQTAFERLEEAERLADRYYQQPASEAVGRWLISDQVTTYVPRPYEEIYVNVLKLLAHLEAGRISGYATVEARRLAGKADMLRDRYLQYEQALSSRESGVVEQAERAGVVKVNEAGEFIESTLGAYLSVVAFMQAGEPAFQEVAARRLIDSIRLQRGLIGEVREDDFTGLADLRRGDANVLIVALSGRGPTLRSVRFGPIVIYTVPLYFELPEVQSHPSEVRGARVEIEGAASEPLVLVEDMAAVASENHRRHLPLVYERTVIRAAAKAGLTATLAELGRRRASDRDQGLVEVGVALAGLLYMAATERADTRCWAFLPGQARVRLLSLPPGRRRVRVAYEGSGGIVHTTDWHEIEVTERGLATVVTHCWR